MHLEVRDDENDPDDAGGALPPDWNLWAHDELNCELARAAFDGDLAYVQLCVAAGAFKLLEAQRVAERARQPAVALWLARAVDRRMQRAACNVRTMR